MAAAQEWAAWPLEDRAAVLLKAAELLATTWRATVNAATLLGQAKTVFQAEIDAAERAARLELKALAASLAVDGAESLLAKQLTPAAQETLVDTFVKSLEGRPN